MKAFLLTAATATASPLLRDTSNIGGSGYDWQLDLTTDSNYGFKIEWLNQLALGYETPFYLALQEEV